MRRPNDRNETTMNNPIYLVEYMARYAEDGCGILAAYDNEDAAIKHANAYAADDPESSYIYYVTTLELQKKYND